MITTNDCVMGVILFIDAKSESRHSVIDDDSPSRSERTTSFSLLQIDKQTDKNF